MKRDDGADFPDVAEEYFSGGGAGVAVPDSEQKDKRRGYKNEIFANDSLTICSGFVSAVKPHVKGEDTLYFARVGLIQGSKQEEGAWVGDITNCDLLVGSTLKKWAEEVAGVEDLFKGVRMTFRIRNLKFTAGIYEGKPVLNSRGILEMVTFGHLND